MTEYIYIALVVSIVYLILKMVLEKMNKGDKENQKTIFRDSLYVGLIVFIVLYVKDYYFSKVGSKAKVFTNEPDF
jgi:4-hydroxybenzoate polyprenyltransferase